jgi:hypothetical protein
MPVLADPKTNAGPIRAVDLERDINTGRIYHLHRATVCPPCTGDCNQGRACSAPDTVPVQPAEACTDLGADDCAPPVSRAGIALVLLPWLLGVIGWAVWARWPLF